MRFFCVVKHRTFPFIILAALRSVYTERDRDRGLAAFAKEWSK